MDGFIPVALKLHAFLERLTKAQVSTHAKVSAGSLPRSAACAGSRRRGYWRR